MVVSHETALERKGTTCKQWRVGKWEEKGQRKHVAGQEPAKTQAALPGGGQLLRKWGLTFSEEQCDFHLVPNTENTFLHLHFFCVNKKWTLLHAGIMHMAGTGVTPGYTGPDWGHYFLNTRSC